MLKYLIIEHELSFFDDFSIILSFERPVNYFDIFIVKIANLA